MRMMLMLLLVPLSLPAQPAARTVAVPFTSGRGSTGHEQASIDVRYVFLDCMGDIKIVYALQRGSLRASTAYWHEGQLTQAPTPPREPSTIPFVGSVWYGDARVGSFRDDVAGTYGGAGCLGQSQVIMRKPANLRTTAEIDRYLNSLRIVVQSARPLRNDARDSEILAARRQAREDSLARVAQARRDSIQRANARAAARRDSLNRVASERRLAAARRADSVSRASQMRLDSMRAAARTRSDSLALLAKQREDSVMLAREQEELERQDRLAADAAEAERLEKARAQRRASDPEGAARETREEEDKALARILAEMRRAQAAAAEAEGDRFYGYGIYWRHQALAKYREAYYALPSDRVAGKIANIESQLQALQTMEELKSALGDALNEVGAAVSGGLDAVGIGRFSGSFLAAEGLGSTKSTPAAPAQSPRSFMYGYGLYRLLVFELRLGYMETGAIRHGVDVTPDGSFRQQPTRDSVSISYKGAGFSLAFGFGLPIQRFVPYLSYGASVVGGPKTMVAQQYEALDGLGIRASHFLNLGLNVRLSQRWALGFQANTNHEIDGGDYFADIEHRTDTSGNSYQIGRPAGLTYRTFALRFYWVD